MELFYIDVIRRYFVRDGYKKESDSDPVYTERKPTDKQFITLLELAGEKLARLTLKLILL